MVKPKPPCTPDCGKRQLGCRNDCPDWKKYEQDKAEYRAARDVEYKCYSAYSAYKRTKITKRLREEQNAKRK